MWSDRPRNYIHICTYIHGTTCTYMYSMCRSYIHAHCTCMKHIECVMSVWGWVLFLPQLLWVSFSSFHQSLQAAVVFPFLSEQLRYPLHVFHLCMKNCIYILEFIRNCWQDGQTKVCKYAQFRHRSVFREVPQSTCTMYLYCHTFQSSLKCKCIAHALQYYVYMHTHM